MSVADLNRQADRLAELLGAGHSLAEALEQVPTKSGEGTVYFIQCDDRGPIKIGFTNGDPRDRMASMQTGNPFRLHLRSHIKAGRHIEQHLHRFFGDSRIGGEWFWADDDLASWAGANPTPNLNTWDDQPS